MKNKIIFSDDYAILENEKYIFYFGYEKTYCDDHQTEDECNEAWCDNRDWCFVATDAITNKELLQMSSSELRKHLGKDWCIDEEDVTKFLLVGINCFLNKF